MRGHNFINMSLANCGPHFCFASQNSSRTVRCQLTRQESLKNWGNRVFISSLKLPTYIQRRITFPTYELNSYSKFLLMNSLKAALFPISVISDLKLDRQGGGAPKMSADSSNRLQFTTYCLLGSGMVTMLLFELTF